MRISSLGGADRLVFMAAWEIAKDKAWNCSSCMKTSTEKLRIKKGCLGSPKAKFTLGEFKLFSCLGNFFNPTAMAVIGAYQQFRLGNLPHAGGYMDQSAWMMDAFALLAELEAKDMKDQEKKAKGA